MNPPHDLGNLVIFDQVLFAFCEAATGVPLLRQAPERMPDTAVCQVVRPGQETVEKTPMDQLEDRRGGTRSDGAPRSILQLLRTYQNVASGTGCDTPTNEMGVHHGNWLVATGPEHRDERGNLGARDDSPLAVTGQAGCGSSIDTKIRCQRRVSEVLSGLLQELPVRWC